MLCTLSFSENNSIPRAAKPYHQTLSDGGLESDMRYNFLLHCMNNCITSFYYKLLLVGINQFYSYCNKFTACNFFFLSTLNKSLIIILISNLSNYLLSCREVISEC